MDQTRRARLEIPVAEPELTRHARLEMPVEGLDVNTWVNILSEAKKRGLSEIPIAGTCKMALIIRSWPAYMDTTVDLNILKEKTIPDFQRTVKNLEYDYTQDFSLQGEVDVSPTKSLVPSIRTRRKRGHGPILLDDPDSDESGSEGRGSEESGSDESGSDDRTSMLTPGLTYTDDDRISMLGALKEDLKFNERVFKRQYSYGAYGSSDPSTFMMDMMDVSHCIKSGTPYVKMDVRHCITSLTRNAFALPEESSGIMWVGVHSGNDICVATLSDRVDWKRVKGFLANLSSKKLLSIFRKCVLSELEDLAGPSSKLCEKLHRSIDDVPFCVVSASTPVYPETPDESGHETSSYAYDVHDAVFLVQESGLLEQAKDSGGAIKLAIFTIQRLMACEAKEIEVTVVSGQRNGRVTIRELGFPEISEYA